MAGSAAKTDQALASAERLEFCREESLRALDQGDWAGALARQEELKRLIDGLTDGDPSLGPELWPRYGDLMNEVLSRLHGVLNAQAEPPLPALPRAQLCWQLYRLLLEHHELPIDEPDWMEVIETVLVENGAIYWYELIGEQPEATARSLALFERLDELLNPGHDWVQVFLSQLRAKQPAVQDQVNVISSDPESVGDQVNDWLMTHGDQGNNRKLRLGLVVLPGTSPASRDPLRLDMNLAPLLSQGDPFSMEAVLTAFIEPLQSRCSGASLEVQDPWSSLYESLSYLWRLGDGLELKAFHQLTLAASIWSRLTGPGQLGAKLLPCSLAPLPINEPGILLQLDDIELATLQSALYDPNGIEEALAQSRKDHLNPAYWQQQDPEWWWRPASTHENIRRFQRDRGFYAGTAAPMESLSCWSRRAVTTLAEAALWSGEISGSWFVLPIAQELFKNNGKLLRLFQTPDLLGVLQLMAGQEVLYVGSLAEEVERHHRSGSSFQLFNDREIIPYGLRCLAPPESRHPARPHSSFEESLEVLLDQADQMQRQRPFNVVVASAGAYRLPILQELRRRYSMTCLGLGSSLHQIFGVELIGDSKWRNDFRRTEHWRILDYSKF